MLQRGSGRGGRVAGGGERGRAREASRSTVASRSRVGGTNWHHVFVESKRPRW